MFTEAQQELYNKKKLSIAQRSMLLLWSAAFLFGALLCWLVTPYFVFAAFAVWLVLLFERLILTRTKPWQNRKRSMCSEMEYRKIKEAELERKLFFDFHRRQTVVECWRRVDGQWIVQDDPFIDDWSEEDYKFLVRCLKRTLRTGGVVFGAFDAFGRLKGFASVEGIPLGNQKQYLDLSSLHVSEELRGRGCGKALFRLAAGWAKERGAEKLYISSHSAVETQAFYRAVGCREAQEYNNEHVEQEPFDCQLEYVL